MLFNAIMKIKFNYLQTEECFLRATLNYLLPRYHGRLDLNSKDRPFTASKQNSTSTGPDSSKNSQRQSHRQSASARPQKPRTTPRPSHPPRQIRVGRRRHVTHSEEKAIKETRKPVKSPATDGRRGLVRDGLSFSRLKNYPYGSRRYRSPWPLNKMDFGLTFAMYYLKLRRTANCYWQVMNTCLKQEKKTFTFTEKL